MQHRFLLQILLLAQHVSGTTMPIIRSSRVLYSGCCLWYFVLWFFMLLVWCGAEGYVSGLQDATASCLLSISHTIYPTSVLQPSPAPRFKTFLLLLIYSPVCSSSSTVQSCVCFSQSAGQRNCSFFLTTPLNTATRT